MNWFLFLFLALCTYFDLKERRIPDKLNLLGFAGGILINLGEPKLIESMGIGFVIGLVLYKVGFWAGGDFKFFIALSAIMPIAKYSIFAPLDAVVYGIVITFIGLVVYSTYKALKTKTIGIILSDVVNYFKVAFPGVYVIVSFSKIHQILSLVGGAILFALSERVRYVLFLGFLGLEAITMTDQVIPKLISNSIALAITFFVTLAIKYYFQYLNRVNVRLDELKEGMIPAETYYIENGQVRKYAIDYNRIAKAFLKSRRIELFPQNIIIDSRKARGLTTDEINKLKELYKEGKIDDEIPIKTSIPLIPFIFAGAIVLQIIGGLQQIII